MRQVVGIIIVIGVVAVMIVAGLTIVSESIAGWNNAEAHRISAQAELAEARGQAQVAVIGAQAESRLHSAQAFSVISGTVSSAVAPYFMALAGLMIVCLVILKRDRPAIQQQPQIIERQVLVLPAGKSRRETWQIASAAVSRLPEDVEIKR